MNSPKPVVAGRSSNGTPLFNCVCPSCGKIRLADYRKLKKRCWSCFNKSRSHVSEHPLYWVHSGMLVRCGYPKASHYKYYGGRGIKVCDEWANDPAAFIKWGLANGYAPGLEIDRIDVDGPYAPWNCQFITHKENSQKRSNARCDAKTAKRIKAQLARGKSVKEIVGALGMPYMVVWHISKGNTWK